MKSRQWVIGLAVACAMTSGPSQVLAEEVMTVTATRTESKIQDAPGAVTVVTAEDIAEKKALDIVDILRDTPGISILGQGVGGRKTISIRGADNRHTLILVDGRRVAASDAVMGHSNYENSWVPIENIERIEVVRGPLSSLYGSEALGGVVNIITKAPTDTFSGSFNVGGGVPLDDGGDTVNLGGSVSGPLIPDTLGFSLSLEKVHERATPDEDEPQYSEIEGRDLTSISPRLVWTPNDNHRIELFGSYSDEERDLFSQSRSSRDQDYLYELRRYTIGIGWHGEIGPTESKVNLYKNQLDKLSIRTYLDTMTTTETPDIATNEVLDAQTSFDLFNTRVTLGGEYRIEGIEADSLSAIGGKEEITYKSVFAQDEIDLFGDRLSLTPGVRYDHHEFFGSELSPRIYALYRLTDRWNLKLGYGHAFNAPTAKQVSPGYDASSGPHRFLGNPDVKAETSDSYEIGLEYYGDVIIAKAFYFYTDVEDLIDYNRIGSFGPGGAFGIFEADNIEEARLMGAEAELTWMLPRGFDITLGYNYLDAEDTKNNVPLQGRPEHTVNFKLGYLYEPFQLKTVVGVQYIGEQFYENASDVLEEVDGYALVNLSATKQLTELLALQVGVENIGDVRLDDESTLYPYEERGRFVFANLKGRF